MHHVKVPHGTTITKCSSEPITKKSRENGRNNFSLLSSKQRNNSTAYVPHIYQSYPTFASSQSHRIGPESHFAKPSLRLRVFSMHPLVFLLRGHVSRKGSPSLGRFLYFQRVNCQYSTAAHVRETLGYSCKQFSKV